MPSSTRRTTLRTLLLLACLLLPAFVFAQNPNEDQAGADDAPVQTPDGPFQINFKNRPSFKLGEFASVDIKAKFHLDWRGFDPNSWNPPAVVNAVPETPPTFYLTRARFGLKGTVTKRVQYEFERDMRQTFGSDHEWHPW